MESAPSAVASVMGQLHRNGVGRHYCNRSERGELLDSMECIPVGVLLRTVACEEDNMGPLTEILQWRTPLQTDAVEFALHVNTTVFRSVAVLG